MVIKLSREDSWVAYVLFLTNRKQLLRSVYVYVAYWTFSIFGRGKNASDEIIWRTHPSTSADPLGGAAPRWKRPGIDETIYGAQASMIYGDAMESLGPVS